MIPRPILAGAPGRVIVGLLACMVAAGAALSAADETPAAPAQTTADDLAEIVVTAKEPRYVAPTRRDRIGRVWAPVYINEKGPFRLVLDTGASRSGITAEVAAALGLVPDASASVVLHGVTGKATVSTVHVDTLRVGDVLIHGSNLPLLPDALGGADGDLGNEGFDDRRIFIDFRHDLIVIARSHRQPAGPGFVSIPFELQHGRLMIASVKVGGVSARAIVDTGAQSTVGNMALRDLLRRSSRQSHTDTIAGVTLDEQSVEEFPVPPVHFGGIEIRTANMVFADTHIFAYWHLTSEPVLQVGMDVLGLLDTLIIDYRRRELQVRLRNGA
jgi:predicted aspartyl protease